MKKLIYTLLFVPISVAANGQQVKYVLYFIEDGMGVSQVDDTEMYQAELQNGRIGAEPLLFTQFPVTTVAITFSATNSITDSAATGAALATGRKTYNSAISVGEDKNPVETVAEKAEKAGKKAGVTTSVSIDHAAPAAFYAHRADRNMDYGIVVDLTKANFNFHIDSGFLKPDRTYGKKDTPNIFPILKEAGYTIARGYSDYEARGKDAGKMILTRKEDKDPSYLSYAVNRKSDDLALAQITGSAIGFLTKGENKGFFLTVGGGKIGWAYHGNSAAIVFNKVEDMGDTIRAVYEFYKKHPKETLVVVTTNREAGDAILGTSKYALNLKALQYQKHSADGLSRRINKLRKSKGNKVTWEDMKEFLGEKMGFWEQSPISWEQEKELRDEFKQSSVRNKVVFAESIYSKSEPMATRAKEVMGRISMVGWVSDGYSADYVPVFAIGAGSRLFGEKIDNTEIPKRIAKTTEYKQRIDYTNTQSKHHLFSFRHGFHGLMRFYSIKDHEIRAIRA